MVGRCDLERDHDGGGRAAAREGAEVGSIALPPGKEMWWRRRSVDVVSSQACSWWGNGKGGWASD